MARKTSSKPPVFTELMQESFGRATRAAAGRAELVGVALAGAKSDPVSKLTPKKATPRKVMAVSAPRTRARKKA